MGFQGKNTGVGCHFLLQQDLFNSGFELMSPALASVCFTTEPPGKPLGKHESEVTQSCQTLCDPMDCSLPGSSVRGDSPGKNTGVGCHALLQGNLSNPGIQPKSPTLQADSLLSEPPGKPPNTGVGSLSLFQGNVPTWK